MGISFTVKEGQRCCVVLQTVRKTGNPSLNMRDKGHYVAAQCYGNAVQTPRIHSSKSFI